MKSMQEANILIVEDQEINIRLLQGVLLREGYTNIVHTADSREALPLYQVFKPDLILLDLHMPHLDGFDVMAQISQYTKDDYVPILILTADVNPEMKQRALSCGAMDFINKPFRVNEVLLRARNFLQARRLHLNLKNENCLLQATLREAGESLEAVQIEMLERLAHAAECRDDDTSDHTRRVGQLAAKVGQKLGMSEGEVALLRRAASLHDIGKIAVPDNILFKPGRLTEDEFETMKAHTEVGARLLQDGHSEMIKMAETIALTHHEKWDGSGYPRKLSGEAIPLVGRIVALTDVFDALTRKRPYKEAWPLQKAREEITSLSGRHFDPKVVVAFDSFRDAELMEI